MSYVTDVQPADRCKHNVDWRLAIQPMDAELCDLSYAAAEAESRGMRDADQTDDKESEKLVILFIGTWKFPKTLPKRPSKNIYIQK